MKQFKDLLENIEACLIVDNICLMSDTTAYYIQRYLSATGAKIETDNSILYTINRYLFRFGYKLNDEKIESAFSEVLAKNAIETDLKFTIYNLDDEPCQNCELVVTYLFFSSSLYLIRANLKISE